MGIGLDILYALGAAASSPWWGWRMLRTGKWRTDWPGRFGRVDPPRPEDADNRPTLLIHAVSVGEVNATRQLVQLLRGQTDWRIIISATTNTGMARANELFAADHPVVRFPLDFTRCVRRFLDAVRPDVVALVELEVWPNFVGACAKRGVPLCVINGRLSERSYRRYARIKALLRPTFATLAAAAVQTDDYAARFRGLGVPHDRVTVTDSMKWDTATIEEPSHVGGADELAAAMGIDRTRPVIVAGSTGPGEEQMLIEAFDNAARTLGERTALPQLMLVPRKPERFDEVAALSPGIVRRTRHADGTRRPLDDAQLFLLDTMGELRKAYALTDVCIVGRSFGGLFGSDPIEPIALGRPTLIGPHYGDFADVVDAFRAGGGIEVTDRPIERAMELLNDGNAAARLSANGRAVIRQRQGATRRHVALLERLMPNQ